MRTIFLSICVALMPVASFAVNDAVQTHADSNASQKQHVDAIEVILQDHKQIKKMIAQLEKNLNSNIQASRSDFQNLKKFLENHETMEEKVWYPQLEKYDDLKNIVATLEKEEKQASTELNDLDNITDDKEWVKKVKKLTNDVKKHAKHEETKLFPKVRKTMDKPTLNEIGNKLESYKNDNQN